MPQKPINNFWAQNLCINLYFETGVKISRNNEKLCTKIRLLTIQQILINQKHCDKFQDCKTYFPTSKTLRCHKQASSCNDRDAAQGFQCEYWYSIQLNDIHDRFFS